MMHELKKILQLNMFRPEDQRFRFGWIGPWQLWLACIFRMPDIYESNCITYRNFFVYFHFKTSERRKIGIVFDEREKEPKKKTKNSQVRKIGLDFFV